MTQQELNWPINRAPRWSLRVGAGRELLTDCHLSIDLRNKRISRWILEFPLTSHKLMPCSKEGR